MPEFAKDVIVAVVGASVALAGLLLVFSGFLFSQAAAFPPATTDDAIINRFRNVGRCGLIPFAGALAVVGLSFA
jgi:ABC-type transport system involved in cytochrome bd biosynthesis fused ATPase/permease subunit